MTKHHGGCHCGAVSFEFEADSSPTLLRCNCSICSMGGLVHLIIPERDFRLLSGADRLTTYTFGSGVARHHFCSVCGVKSFYVPRSNPDGVSVNFNCVDRRTFDDDVTIDEFDGENWEDNAADVAYLSR